MFDSAYFPTSVEVLDTMGIDCLNKIVLEPSGGSGNIVDYLKSNGAKDVIAFEKHDELRTILSTKCRVLGADFLKCTAEDISHIDMIVMNPPFHSGEEHIVHAYDIAPEGCEIIALCNWQTIEKDYRYGKIEAYIKNYGTADNLGTCFDTADRKTNIEIGLVKLYKPVLNRDDCFDGFFMDEDEEEAQGDGIMAYNEVRALVNRYVGAVKIFDRLDEVKDELKYVTAELGLSKFTFNVGYNEEVVSKEDFAKFLQKKSWAYIFDKMNMKKYVTSGVMKDINKFVERQHNVPFTMKNVYKMFDIIVGTREDTMKRALTEAIDNFTKYTRENRFGVEGWKTNEGHMLNKKFIVERMVDGEYKTNGKVDLAIGGVNADKLYDLVKVLCNLTGENYDSIPSLRDIFHKEGGLETSTWYKWGFFEFKVFKKGTMHLKFNKKEDWYILNKTYGEIKGFVLPETHL